MARTSYHSALRAEGIVELGPVGGQGHGPGRASAPPPGGRRSLQRAHRRAAALAARHNRTPRRAQSQAAPRRGAAPCARSGAPGPETPRIGIDRTDPSKAEHAVDLETGAVIGHGPARSASTGEDLLASRRERSRPACVVNGRLRHMGKGAVRRAPPCVVSRVDFYVLYTSSACASAVRPTRRGSAAMNARVVSLQRKLSWHLRSA